MNTLVAAPVLVALAVGVQAPVEEQSSQSVLVPVARVKECTDQGGCAFLTQDELLALYKKWFAAGAKAGAKAVAARLDSNGCLEGNT